MMNKAYLSAKDEAIIEWLTGAEDAELSPAEVEEWEKINFMDDMIRKYIQPQKAIKAWMRKFEKPKSSAYACYNKTQFIIGSTNIVNKKYHTNLLVEVLDKSIKICLDNDNTKDIPRLVEQKAKLLELGKTDPIDPNTLRPAKIILEPNAQVLKINPPKRSEFEKMVKQLDLPKDLTEAIMLDAETIEFDESN